MQGPIRTVSCAFELTLNLEAEIRHDAEELENLYKGNRGYDAAARKYLNLVEAGIIDPTKVVRLALENTYRKPNPARRSTALW